MQSVLDQQVEEELRIRIQTTEKKADIDFFSTLLHIYSESFIPKPALIRLSTGVSYPVNGFTDPFIISKLKEELKGGKYAFELFWQDESNNTAVDPSGTVYSLVEVSLLQKCSEIDLINFIRKVAETTCPEFVACTLHRISRKIYRQHFEWEDRTKLSPNLGWLQYFGPEEFKRQGGEAIFSNPYIQAQRLGEGILIQVGESPFDAYSPEGEDLLVKATKAMPTVLIDNV